MTTLSQVPTTTTTRENLLETLLGSLVQGSSSKAELFQRRQNRHEVANLLSSLALLTQGFVLLPGALNVSAEIGMAPLGIV